MSNIVEAAPFAPPTWTSRQAVADALMTLAETAEEAVAICAAGVLRVLALPAQAPRLLAVVRARDRPMWVRTYALRAHRALGAELPSGALAALFDERSETHTDPVLACRGALCSSRSTKLDLGELVRLARTSEEQARAIALLERLPREARAELLSWQRTCVPGAAPEVAAWLERQWRADTEEGSLGKADLWVAYWSPSTDLHARGVLLRHHAAGPRRGEGFWEDLARCPALAALLDETTRREAALALPLGDLLAVLGCEGLRRALRAAIHAESSHRRCSTASDAPASGAHRRALAVLSEWDGGPALALGLLRGAVLDPSVRADLVLALFERDRGLALRVLSARLGAADDREALIAVLMEIVRAPVEGDRAFLRAALRVHAAGVRYRAIEALDKLGDAELPEERAAYHDMLRVLARSDDARVRVRASFTLARGGDPAHREALVAAMRDPDAAVRADAIRRLGWLGGAAEHRALIEAALVDPAREPDGYYHPVADQAALALGMIGDPRSLTPLLAAAFAPSSMPGQTAIEAAIAVIVAKMEGRADLTRTPGERVAHEDHGMASCWSPFARNRLVSLDE